MTYTDADMARWWPEEGKGPSRTPFERDRARVVHSSALRRLGAKTQVHRAGSDDFVRTRLTHSLEVAQVGRELGKALGCDPDVVDAACLAHDLGHPPFGHAGEEVLDSLTRSIGGFEGNAQTLRLLTRLEPKVIDPVTGRSVGLNLTRASLDAVCKYPWRRLDLDEPTKFGVYADDADVFAWVRMDAPERVRCIEAQVMDFSDDVAYSVHDIEDAIVGGHLDGALLDDPGMRADVVTMTRRWYGTAVAEDQLDDALVRLAGLPYWVRGFDGSRAALAALKDLTSQLIGRFCAAVETQTRSVAGPGPLTRFAADLVVPHVTAAEILALKGVCALRVMHPRSMAPGHARQQDVVAELFEALCAEPEALEPAFAADWSNAIDEGGRTRVIVDQIASLTDVSVVHWHGRLTGRSDRPAVD